MLNLKFFWQIDGTYKDGMRKYFQQQKKDTCHKSFQSIMWSLPYLLTVVNLRRGVEWVGRFVKNFQKGGKGNH